MCNTLHEIYPKTVRTEIMLEADGTAVPLRELSSAIYEMMDRTKKQEQKYSPTKNIIHGY